MNNETLFTVAKSMNCKATWHDGIFGLAWHCGCDDQAHAVDSQCSMITLDSLLQHGGLMASCSMN